MRLKRAPCTHIVLSYCRNKEFDNISMIYTIYEVPRGSAGASLPPSRSPRSDIYHKQKAFKRVRTYARMSQATKDANPDTQRVLRLPQMCARATVNEYVRTYVRTYLRTNTRPQALWKNRGAPRRWHPKAAAALRRRSVPRPWGCSVGGTHPPQPRRGRPPRRHPRCPRFLPQGRWCQPPPMLRSSVRPAATSARARTHARTYVCQSGQ